MAWQQLIVFALLQFVSASVASSCRCLPSNACWPSHQAWSALNASLQGRLVSVSPPAAPCHDPSYDPALCAVAQEKWNNTMWRADQVGGMQVQKWERDGNKSCPIDTSRASPCSLGGTPLYAVNVSQEQDVQLGIRFASRHNLRLVIKNTGHDFLGRSTAPGSFSIWLHHLKSIRFHTAFVPKGKNDQSYGRAVTAGAGVQWEELYRAVSEQVAVIVGGSYPSIAVGGGFVQGGGHGPISPEFGLAADNVLQYKLVTADGKVVTANDCENEDLFWALRGGGGGTFGVVLSVTYKIHPALKQLVYGGFQLSAANGSSFRELVIKFVELYPSLAQAGWTGYFYVFPPPQSVVLTQLLMLNRSLSFANQTLEPLYQFARVTGSLEAFSSFLDYYLHAYCNGQSNCSRLATRSPAAQVSRLIPNQIFQRELERLKGAMINILDMNIPMFVNAIAGGAVSEPVKNAVNPAWRGAIWNLILATFSEDPAAARQLSEANKILAQLAPDSGSYVNEADYFERSGKARCSEAITLGCSPSKRRWILLGCSFVTTVLVARNGVQT